VPWSTDDYPRSWKNLDEGVRDKAIEIANALVADGMEEDRAIPIALAQARKSLTDAGSDLWLVPEGEGWALQTEGADEPEQTFGTKEAALDAAVSLARERGVVLTVQRGDGTIEDRQSFRSRID